MEESPHIENICDIGTKLINKIRSRTSIVETNLEMYMYFVDLCCKIYIVGKITSLPHPNHDVQDKIAWKCIHNKKIFVNTDPLDEQSTDPHDLLFNDMVYRPSTNQPQWASPIMPRVKDLNLATCPANLLFINRIATRSVHPWIRSGTHFGICFYRFSRTISFC